MAYAVFISMLVFDRPYNSVLTPSTKYIHSRFPLNPKLFSAVFHSDQNTLDVTLCLTFIIGTDLKLWVTPWKHSSSANLLTVTFSGCSSELGLSGRILTKKCPKSHESLLLFLEKNALLPFQSFSVFTKNIWIPKYLIKGETYVHKPFESPFLMRVLTLEWCSEYRTPYLNQQTRTLHSSLISKNLTDVCNNQLTFRINPFIEGFHGNFLLFYYRY